MPEVQQGRGSSQPRQQKRRRNTYRTQDVGANVALQTRRSREGGTIVRMVAIREEEGVQLRNGRKEKHTYRRPAPGGWIDVRDVHVEQLCELIDVLQKEAELNIGLEQQQRELRYRPFKGFNLAQLLVEGVEDAARQPKPRQPKPRQPKPNIEAQVLERIQRTQRRIRRNNPVLDKLEQIHSNLRKVREAYGG